MKCYLVYLHHNKSFVFFTEQALRRHLNRLPEPPLVRENLKKEITMFVEMLQQRATEGGR